MGQLRYILLGGHVVVAGTGNALENGFFGVGREMKNPCGKGTGMKRETDWMVDCWPEACSVILACDGRSWSYWRNWRRKQTLPGISPFLGHERKWGMMENSFPAFLILFLRENLPFRFRIAFPYFTICRRGKKVQVLDKREKRNVNRMLIKCE